MNENQKLNRLQSENNIKWNIFMKLKIAYFL